MIARGEAGGDDTGPVEVSREVFAGIDAVRLSGLVNMLARDVVARIAEEMGFAESAAWVRGNEGLYARAVFHGFRVEGPSSVPPALV